MTITHGVYVMDERITKEFKKIIERIPKGTIFDAHYIIEKFFKENMKNANLYLECHTSNNINVWNAQLSAAISSFNGELIEPLREKSYSLDILRRACKCNAWRRK